MPTKRSIIWAHHTVTNSASWTSCCYIERQSKVLVKIASYGQFNRIDRIIISCTYHRDSNWMLTYQHLIGPNMHACILSTLNYNIIILNAGLLTLLAYSDCSHLRMNCRDCSVDDKSLYLQQLYRQFTNSLIQINIVFRSYLISMLTVNQIQAQIS